jgi:antitoxin HigA-1
MAVHWVMIGSFRDAWLQDFFVDDKKSKWVPSEIADRLFRKLQLIDDATCDADLRSPPSNHFEKLAGKLKALHSIRVNQQWRLILNGTLQKVSRVRSIWIITVTNEAFMIITKRAPVRVGEILTEEFLLPLGLTQQALADAMAVPRKHVSELCNNRRSVTADTALMLARVFGTSADFWLNIQRRTDLWEALNTAERRARINRARPLRKAA